MSRIQDPVFRTLESALALGGLFWGTLGGFGLMASFWEGFGLTLGELWPHFGRALDSLWESYISMGNEMGNKMGN